MTRLMTVEVRQWSRRCFAAYVFDGDRFGRFVGTESSRSAANVLGNRSLFDTENRCGVTEIGSHPTSVEGGHVRESTWPGRASKRSRPPSSTSEAAEGAV